MSGTPAPGSGGRNGETGTRDPGIVPWSSGGKDGPGYDSAKTIPSEDTEAVGVG